MSDPGTAGAAGGTGLVDQPAMPAVAPANGVVNGSAAGAAHQPPAPAAAASVEAPDTGETPVPRASPAESYVPNDAGPRAAPSGFRRMLARLALPGPGAMLENMSAWAGANWRWWGASVVGHAVLFAFAGLMLGSIQNPNRAPPMIDSFVDTVVRDVTSVELAPLDRTSFSASSATATDATTNNVGLPKGHSSAMAGSGSVQMSGAVGDAPGGPGGSGGLGGTAISLADIGISGVSGAQLQMDVPEGTPGEPSAIVQDMNEAMDRVTHEIHMMLLKGDVLVVWLFDQSESMKDDQKEIRDRVYRVYQELGLTDEAKDGALLTSVASFGDKVRLETQKPTDDINKIKSAIDGVPLDRTGLEHTCPAIGTMINHHRKFATSGRRQMALIVLTDESGEPDDNMANLEGAINEAKSARCKVYVMGREAVFGYPLAHMSWVHPQTGGVHWLPINRGPETPFPEQLQTNGFHRRYDAHPSGFGPYEQARICRETGGVFFLLPSPEADLVGRDDRQYDLEAMRPYLPDLSPRDKYAATRDKSELRATLWKVISDLNPYRPDRAKDIEMTMHFVPDPQAFAAQVRAEQAKAAVYVRYLHEAEQALEKIKSRRDNEPNPRWRANYDLLFAQVLAYKVRLYEYGAYLEAFVRNPKSVPFTKAPNLTLGRWDITHRTETITGEQTRSYIERSAQMFERVKKEHPGTPFAARAEFELSRGFGVELIEQYYGPPGPASTTPVTIKVPNL